MNQWQRWKLEFHAREVPLPVVALAVALERVIVVSMIVAMVVLQLKCEQIHVDPAIDTPSLWIVEYPWL